MGMGFLIVAGCIFRAALPFRFTISQGSLQNVLLSCHSKNGYTVQPCNAVLQNAGCSSYFAFRRSNEVA